MTAAALKLQLALRFHEAGSFDQAERLYREILDAEAGHAEALHLLGVLAHQTGRNDIAVDFLSRALAANGTNPVYHCRLGIALAAMGRLDDAASHNRRALALKPDYAEANNNLGTLLAAEGRDDEAVALYRKAIATKPDFAEAHNNLGASLKDLGRVDEAIAAHQAAIRLRPDYAEAHKNLGLALLLDGRFTPGFAEFDWRWREPGAWRRTFPHPLWEGTPLAGRKILIWGEQGVGDQVMFASVIAPVIADVRACVLECDPRLVPVLARAFPRAEVVARRDPPDPATLSGDIDVQSSIGSLCRWLRPRRAAFEPRRAYLKADTARRERLRARYRALAPGPIVGIAWRSRMHEASPRLQRFAATKSTALEQWAPVLTTPGVGFVNLQYGDCADDLAAVERRLGVRVHHDPEIDQLADLDGFVAQIDAMDLVISTSMTGAHIAGALGKRTRILLSHVPDWRWQRTGAESLWYPNVRLLRQPAPGAWAPVLAEAAALLAAESRVA